MKKNVWMQLVDVCDRIVMLLLLILAADCAIFGAGKTVSIGPFGFRIFVTGLVMVAAIPLIINRLSGLLRNAYTWFLALFLCWMAVSAVRGYANGNSTALLASDIKGFSYLLLFFPAVSVLTSRERIHRLMKVVVFANVVLAAAMLLALVAYNWFPEFFIKLYDFDRKHYLSMWSAITDKVPRLFFKSTPYFLCNCAFSTYLFVVESEKKSKWIYSGITGVSLFGLLMSYTRSIYLATAVAAVVLILTVALHAVKNRKTPAWRHIIASVLVFGFITASFSLVMKADYLGYAISRLGVSFYVPQNEPTDADPTVEDPTVVGPTVENMANPPATEKPLEGYQQDTVNSDQIRKKTLLEVRGYIAESPLMGKGLGKGLLCRKDGAHEYFFEDLLMKTGVIGLVLYLAPILYTVYLTFKSRKQDDWFLLRGSWLAVLIGFCAFSYFNPYMNASLGITFWCFTMGVFTTTEKTNNGG